MNLETAILWLESLQHEACYFTDLFARNRSPDDPPAALETELMWANRAQALSLALDVLDSHQARLSRMTLAVQSGLDGGLISEDDKEATR